MFPRLNSLIAHSAFIPAAIGVALLLRGLLFLVAPADPVSDAGWYMARAVEISQGLGYQENGHPTAFWPIGWPAILAGTYWVTGSMPGTIITLHLLATMIIMLSILWFGRTILKDESAARLAIAGYAIYPTSIAFSTTAMTETIYPALFMPGVALIIAGRHHWPKLVWGGLILGVATLVKPQTYGFLIGLVIVMYWSYRDFSLSQAARTALIGYVCLFAVVLPWSLRNTQVFGEFVLISTNTGSVMYYAANDDTTGQYIPLKDLYTKLGLSWENRVRDQVAQDKIFKDKATNWIHENPAEYLSWIPTKLYMFWAKDASGFWNLERTYPHHKTPIFIGKIVNQLFYLLVLALSVPCFLVALRGLFSNRYADDRPMLLLWCLPIFVSLMAMAFAGLTRYHYPAIMFMLLGAGWTISQLTQHFTRVPK